MLSDGSVMAVVTRMKDIILCFMFCLILVKTLLLFLHFHSCFLVLQLLQFLQLFAHFIFEMKLIVDILQKSSVVSFEGETLNSLAGRRFTLLLY